MKEIKKLLFYDIEKAILNNITRVAIYTIIILFSIEIFYSILGKSFLDVNSFITIIGAIIVFWYGYKKYERDKELQIIEKYTEKYNILISKLYLKRSRSNYRKLFNLFYEEFFLYSKGYISDELWEQWNYWIKGDLEREFKKETYICIGKKIYEENENNSNDFFKHLFEQSGENTNLKVNGKSFYEYFIN